MTICAAGEWIYQTNNARIQDVISSIFEFISGCLCDMIIIFQFIPYHFKSEGVSDIARTSLVS